MKQIQYDYYNKMDNDFIIEGQADQIQKYLLAELSSILRMKVSREAKIGLVEGFMAALREK